MATDPSTLIAEKPHYLILDGLRGVAALTVVAFHLLEAHATSHFDQMLNHGYLAVDFFFVLSGFVIGYAYDDRWEKMSVGTFFKRRLVRLQPMIVLGMVVGAACYYFQATSFWPMIEHTPVWKMLLVMVIGCTLLPVPPSMDIRGWNEMHPLNGPAWSLFFEYIANILYALVIRRFSKTVLSIAVFIAGCALIHLAVTSPQGDIIGGWSVEPRQLRIGFTRLLYPFLAGLLLSRIAKPGYVKNAFLWSSLLIVVFLSIPRIGGHDHLWMNGLYDSLTIILVFPLIVYLGACGKLAGKGFATKICRFFGDISYPIYITHYPLIYIYTAWVNDGSQRPFSETWPFALVFFISAILLAYASLKLYDEPVRKWLKKKI